MEIPDTIHNFLKPLVVTPANDEAQLPPNLPRQLASIINHFQNKRGNTVLFTGASVSVFTSAANLLAKLMNTEIYRIDLSAVASKHLGETEKNLLQVFEFVEQRHFILLFDEVDGMFNKRTNIRSEEGRYANLDINYLLKRIAAYPGMVIITSNAGDDLDDTLRQAVPWKIDLAQSVSRQNLSLWQRFLNRFRKKSYN